MPDRQTTPDRVAVVLPIGFNAWLLDCAPAPDCKVCAANWRQLVEHRDQGRVYEAAKHATEIRDHQSGVHEDEHRA